MSQLASLSPFECVYEPLLPHDDRFGRVAVLPWDADIFGFAVADYRLGDVQFIWDNRQAWQEGIRQWTQRQHVLLLSCDVRPTDRKAAGLLYSSNFLAVDTTLQATLGRLHKATLPKPTLSFRSMQSQDLAEVERIAETAFQFGRYHTDPHFSAALARRRYVHWVKNAFTAPEVDGRMFILGHPGEVSGFFHLVMRGDLGDLRLAAIDPRISTGGRGYELYLNALHVLRDYGVRRVTAKISAANTAVLDIYAMFGFRFSKPRIIFHWHPPDAPAWID
jgi:hypothetical protein